MFPFKVQILLSKCVRCRGSLGIIMDVTIDVLIPLVECLKMMVDLRLSDSLPTPLVERFPSLMGTY